MFSPVMVFLDTTNVASLLLKLQSSLICLSNVVFPVLMNFYLNVQNSLR